MKNTTQPPLIIAGIGEQQLYAAAILLCRWPDADLETASEKHLATVLADAAKIAARTIYIVGVPCKQYPDKIQAAATAAARKKHLLIWFGLEGQKAPAKTAWEEHVVQSTDSMAETVLRITVPPRRTEHMLRLCAVAKKVIGTTSLNSREEELAGIAKSALWTATDLRNFDACRQGIFRLAGIRQPVGNYPFPFDSFINHYTMWGADRPSTNKSDAAKKTYSQARMLGDEGECRVLITGETGTGKENIARLIHASSWRMDKPFIAFNCAELSPQLLEGKLFGYMKGAFTGAEKTHTGVFESANDGTLFLDEVAELSPVAQAGLLRVLQEGRFMPLGGEKEVEVNVRVLAATNQPLKAMMKAGKFREDLYYRLNAVILHLPPLRERKEDIEAIAWGYWKRRPTPEQLQVLCSYSWPGNVRELLSILDRARIFKKEDSLSEVMPAEESGTSGTKDESLKSAIRAHVHKIHTRHEQNNTRAAKALGISINTLKKHLGITV